MKTLEKAPILDWNEPEFPIEILEYLRQPQCKKLLEKLNVDYLYWDKVKYYTLPEISGLTNEKLWNVLTFKRESDGIPINFGKYSFQYVLTNHILKSLHDFDMKFGGNLNFDSTPEIDKRQYLVSSLMEEAIASSQIEGAVTTRKKAKEMLRKNLPPKNISEQMIMNNFLSINRISSLKNKKLTPSLILEIHKNITFQTLENSVDEGRFRTTNDIDVVDSIDNEIVYSPPNFEEIPGLIDELCEFFNSENEDIYIHPIIKGCIIHFMIGWIHPFVDGNGRTARALFYWYMLSQGYWLIEYMSISRLIIKSKVQYGRAYLYSETDRNDLTYFINYKTHTLHKAFNSLLAYIQKKVKEKKQFKLISKIGHINERQAEIIRKLYDEEDQLLSVRELINIFAVADQTIRNDVKGLMEKGIVKEIPLNNKTSVYGRGENFEEFISTTFKK